MSIVGYKLRPTDRHNWLQYRIKCIEENRLGVGAVSSTVGLQPEMQSLDDGDKGLLKVGVFR